MKAGQRLGTKITKARLQQLNMQFGYMNNLLRTKRRMLLQRTIAPHKVDRTKKDIESIWTKMLCIERTRRHLMTSFYIKEQQRAQRNQQIA